MEEKIVSVINEMAGCLNIAQLKKLQETMLKYFNENNIKEKTATNDEYLTLFLEAKEMEGCSKRTLVYYKTTIEHLFKNVHMTVRKMNTEIIRSYLVDYQNINNCSKVTLDNVRRNISSFFHGLKRRTIFLKVLCDVYIRLRPRRV